MDMIKNLLGKHFKMAPMGPFKAGDTVQVHVKIQEGEKTRTQIFEGVVIRKKRGGFDSSFTVRKISHGVGVERIFPYYSSSLQKVEVVSRGIARRSRLYYLRRLEGKAARLESEHSLQGSVTATGDKVSAPTGNTPTN